jgi:ATP-dependent RNA helicase SrmB
VFADFSLDPRLQQAIDQQELIEPTPVQLQAIPLAMAGRDLLVTAATGTGKTAAFLIPIINQLLTDPPARDTGTVALILAPTRELARQVLSHCRKLCKFTHLQSNVITGGAEFKYQKALLRKNPEILIATPGRILEHVTKESANFSDLRVLVLDEADRMLDMGMQEEALKVVEACNKNRQSIMLSATLKHKKIMAIAEQALNEPEKVIVNTAREKHENITQKILLTDDVKHKEKSLVHLLNEAGFSKAMVFTNTIVQANRLVGVLKYHDLRAGVLSGDLMQDERNHVMNLMRRGHIDVLVCTDVAARGLDIEGVDLVVNFDMARKGDEYIHRIGRTGRAGSNGTAIAFIGLNDWNLMSSIERYLKINFERISIKGLEAKFKGPKKLKASGKAAGTKKKKQDKAGAKKETKRTQKRAEKRRRPKEKTFHDSSTEEGFQPLRKKT